MSEEKKRSRRVVSRREYAALKSKKIGTSVLGILLFLLGTLSLLWGGAVLIEVQINNAPAVSDNSVAMNGFGLWLLGVAWLLCRRGSSVVRKASRMESVVPLTRHNTGDLPEEETLVRASDEPPAHQADVLLRAAQGGQETPEEQLLRPVSE